LIAGILLAAGAASRFGGGKLQQALPDGTPLCVAAARNLLPAVDEVVAVVRPGDGAVRDTLAREPGVRVIECERAHEGMGLSLACGVRASLQADGWIVALADMPRIQTKTIRQITERLRAGAFIVAPVYRGERGHPVGLGGRFRDQLLALSGDAGAREILKAQPDELSLIDVDDAGCMLDIDTQSDLSQLRK
jgi:molybdenum cofactor cytidylyltransferase